VGYVVPGEDGVVVVGLHGEKAGGGIAVGKVGRQQADVRPEYRDALNRRGQFRGREVMPAVEELEALIPIHRRCIGIGA
jgi:hypothetical protein